MKYEIQVDRRRLHLMQPALVVRYVDEDGNRGEKHYCDRIALRGTVYIRQEDGRAWVEFESESVHAKGYIDGQEVVTSDV